MKRQKRTLSDGSLSRFFIVKKIKSSVSTSSSSHDDRLARKERQPPVPSVARPATTSRIDRFPNDPANGKLPRGQIRVLGPCQPTDLNFPVTRYIASYI